MKLAPTDIKRIQDPDGLIRYEVFSPHPPEVPACERISLPFYVMEPKGGINSETVPVMVLHGHKEYGPSNVIRTLLRFIASRKNFLVFVVDYLGLRLLREKTDFKLAIDDMCIQISNAELKNRNYPPIKLEPIPDVFQHLIQMAQAKEPSQPNPILATYRKLADDHFDNGLVQAIDCLWAIRILKNDYPTIDWSALTSIGTSHGGYLATQCARFAPNTFALSIDAFGPTKPVLRYIYKMESKVTLIDPMQQSFDLIIGLDPAWSQDPKSPCYFSPDRNQIRTLNDESQLMQWRKQIIGPGALHIFSQLLNDAEHPVLEKDQLIEHLKALNFDLEYHKDGMSTELKDDFSLTFFILQNITAERLKKHPVNQSDFERKSQITYDCGKTRYIIDYRNEFPILKVETLSN